MKMTRESGRSGAGRPESLGLLLLVGVVALGGCNSAGHRSDISYSSPHQRGLDEEIQGDRPPTATTLYAMARILMAQGREEECGFVLGRITQEHPRFMPAYCELSELHLRHRRVEEAMAVLTAGLAVSPQDPVLLNNLGMCWMLKADYERALGVFTQASSVAPQDARCRANMAVALGMLGNYEEALRLYEQVVPAADAHYNLGVLCEARNDLARAEEEYRRAEALSVVLTESEVSGRAEVESSESGAEGSP